MRLHYLSEVLGFDLKTAEQLRDDMEDLFVSDVEVDLCMGLLGESEPMMKYGLRVKAVDIPPGSERERVAARLIAYDAQFRERHL